MFFSEPSARLSLKTSKRSCTRTFYKTQLGAHQCLELFHPLCPVWQHEALSHLEASSTLPLTPLGYFESLDKNVQKTPHSLCIHYSLKPYSSLCDFSWLCQLLSTFRAERVTVVTLTDLPSIQPDQSAFFF